LLLEFLEYSPEHTRPRGPGIVGRSGLHALCEGAIVPSQRLARGKGPKIPENHAQ
jgi:hypothetical protein